MQEQPGVSPEHDPMSIPYPSQGETVTQPESVRRDTAAPAAPAPAAGAGHADAALIAKVKAEIDADAARLTGIFKDIHEHPELGFMETRTADIVARELKALGFEVTTGIGKTGVVGILRNGDDPTVMYRADMDANAVEEATGLPYASKVRGHRGDGKEVPVGHMCGHDAHVTWMLGMARHWSRQRQTGMAPSFWSASPPRSLELARRRWWTTDCMNAMAFRCPIISMVCIPRRCPRAR